MMNLLPQQSPSVWPVGQLCRAIAEALDAGFNPVTVSGEIAGFTRAASGHCYFTLKDEGGQIRCAMFRRAAALLQQLPREGDRVEVRGRLGVYEARGELQLVVEALRPVGQGNWFEQFLLLKNKLEQEGLFDPARKRPLPAMPRSIGLVTSLGAAALHDVVTAWQRRVPHIPVVLVPASVQGERAPGELVQALLQLYAYARQPQGVPLDVIVLVRGGGSMEDLWAFNDETLARTITQSPVPLVSGVGHETDFTIADFVADVRAPTPTAAAELVATPRAQCLQACAQQAQRLQNALLQAVDRQAQRVDRMAARLGRPSGLAASQQLRWSRLAQRHQVAGQRLPQLAQQRLQTRTEQLQRSVQGALQQQRQRLSHAELRLQLLDPRLVLQRGYAWLQDAQGSAITTCSQLAAGDAVQARLTDGVADMTVHNTRLI